MNQPILCLLHSAYKYEFRPQFSSMCFFNRNQNQSLLQKRFIRAKEQPQNFKRYNYFWYKMIVLSLSRKIQRFIGVYRGNLEDPKNYAIKLVLNFIFISGMMSIVFGSFASIFVNFMDFQSSTNSMIVMMAGASGVGCYTGITSNTGSITKLYNIIQNLADESNIISAQITLDNRIQWYNFHFDQV